MSTNQPSLQLVGAPTPQQIANRKPKHRWSLDEKMESYALIKVKKMNAAEAFEFVAKKYGFELADSYTEHPHSHVNRFQKGFQKVIRKAIENGTVNSDPIIAKLREYGLINDPSGQAAPAQPTTPVAAPTATIDETELPEELRDEGDEFEDGELEGELTAEEQFAEESDED